MIMIAMFRKLIEILRGNKDKSRRSQEQEKKGGGCLTPIMVVIAAFVVALV